MLGTPYAFAGPLSTLLLAAAWVCLWFTAKSRNVHKTNSAKLAAQLHVLEQQSPEGIVVIDRGGSIRRVNEAAQQMFGYTDAELHRQKVFRLIDELPEPGLSGIDLETVRKDGSRVRMHCRARKVPGETGPNAETYLFFVEPEAADVPDAAPAEATLEVAERVVNRIVRQMEGLLTTINGYTELALHGMADNSPARKDLEEIATASDAASSLARHLLAFGGNQPIPLEYVDVNALLGNLQPKIEAVQMEISAEHLYVLANSQCLQQIVTIFCGSASHRAGPEAAKQIVTSRRRQGEAEYAAIAISDRGPALPAETLTRLFEPLFLDREGLGVELSAVYGMVRNLGGAIHVASDAERGTTFEILIPLAQMGGNGIAAPAVDRRS